MQNPIWVSEATVIAVHHAQLTEHGGGIGIRDHNALASALHHPQQLFHYGETDIFVLAAGYAERIAKNHAFVDANKRSAYIIMCLFVKLNGYEFTAPKTERVTQMVALAASEITSSDLAAWLKKNCAKLKKNHY